MDASELSELIRRISLLERKVSHLYEIAQREEPDFESDLVSDEVKLLVQQNRTIDAIRLHQQQTGVGLAEAKDAVDSLSATG
jgi:ribosomal protein L7/L12